MHQRHVGGFIYANLVIVTLFVKRLGGIGGDTCLLTEDDNLRPIISIEHSNY